MVQAREGYTRLFVALKYVTLPVLVTPSPTVRPDVSSYTCEATLMTMTETSKTLVPRLALLL